MITGKRGNVVYLAIGGFILFLLLTIAFEIFYYTDDDTDLQTPPEDDDIIPGDTENNPEDTPFEDPDGDEYPGYG